MGTLPSTEDDAFFWEGLERGELLVRKCATCGALQHPPTPMCPRCGSLEWQHHACSGHGTLLSWIVSHHPTQPDDDPRIVALVQLDEGVRMVGNLEAIAEADVRNDMAVQAGFATVDGNTWLRFHPAGAGK